jgi:hypothetical protein
MFRSGESRSLGQMLLALSGNFRWKAFFLIRYYCQAYIPLFIHLLQSAWREVREEGEMLRSNIGFVLIIEFPHLINITNFKINNGPRTYYEVWYSSQKLDE